MRRTTLRRMGVRRTAAFTTAAAAGLCGLLPSQTLADNVTLNNGDNLNYTPSQLVGANGASQRLTTGEPAVSNSTEINFNATATSTATAAQFIFNSTTLDTITGLTATTALESVAKLNITTGGAYTIYWNTDDGSRLYIDGQLIINNEGGHGDTRLSKIVNLDAGLHDLRGLVINNGGAGGMQLSYSGPDQTTRALVPSTALFQAENTSANALSAAFGTGVRANNITPVTVGTAPDNVTLTAGAAATINLNGSSYAIAGLGTLSAGAGSTLNVTGTIGAGADTRRQLRFTGAATFNGGATVNTTLDLGLGGQVTGVGANTLTKLGAGRLILDNNSATANDFTGSTIDIQGGAVYAVGSNVSGATNPLSTATVNLNGGALQLDLQGNGTAGTSVTFNNTITVGATGGTLQTLSGPGTYNLTSTNAINIPAGATLTLNTFGGSNNVVGSTLVLSAPLSGTGALIKNVTPGSTAGINANVVGVAANRDVGQVILLGDSSGFSGPITLATTTATGASGSVTVQPGILEGRAATATAKPFGTGTITLQGGQLNLRGTSAAAAVQYLFGNNIVVAGNAIMDANLVAPGTANGVINLGTLSIGGQTLTVNGGNGYSIAHTGTTLTGNPTFTINTANLSLGPVDEGGTARTTTKNGAGTLIYSATATNLTGNINVTAGQVNGAATNSLGSATVTLSNSGSEVLLTSQNSGAKYVVPANTIFAGNTAGFTGITRTAAAPAAGQVQLSAGAAVAETAAGQNAAFATSGNLGTAGDLFFGLGADLTDSFTVSGSIAGITPWRGFSNDRSARTLTGGTVTAASNFAIQGFSGTNIQLGPATIAAANPVTGNVTLGRLNLGITNAPTLNSNLTLTAASGAAIQFNLANALGSSGTAASNARAVAYAGGTLDPGPAGSMSGNITLETGGILQFNDANNLGGVGTITAEPGAIIDYASNTGQSANGTATQNISTGFPAGVIYRTNIANVVGFGTGAVTGTNPAGVYEVNGTLGETINVSAGTPTRAGFLSGVVTQGNAAQTISGSVVIGPGGATIAASSGGTLTLSAPITISGSTPTSLTIGTDLIIDPSINNAPRNAGVLLTGANVFDNGGGGVINQVNVRGRSNLTGTNTGAGNLPQGTGVGLDLGGTFQINGVAAGGTVQLGALKPNGGILFLNRNATPTAGLIVNLNSPVNRPAAFGPENRGTATLMLLSGQAFNTSTDKVTFSAAGNAPSRVVVNGGTTINMLPPWLVGTDSASPSNNTTFLDALDPTGAGVIPATYVAMPLTGGAGTEIADNTAATTLTGDITVAALRTNNAISGTNTINLTSGGLLIRGTAAAFTISPNINFGANEGVIGNVQSNQVVTLSGKISGTNGLTKFGANSLVLSNAANDFTGGVTIDEANLRPGVASTATASPFGFNAVTGFNPVTINTAGTLDLNGQVLTIGGLQGTGFVTGANTTTLTMNVPAGNTFTFGGTFTNTAFNVTKTGSGTQILTGTLANTGTTTVSAGLLRVDGYSTAASNYSIASSATLGGSGIITGTVNVASGGNLAPGASPGLLRTGSLTITSGGNYVVDLNGPTAGSGYDQTEVIGTVNIAGANLVATLNYSPAVGDKLYIINNDGFDPIAGTFSVGGTPVPQGGTINLVSTADGITYPFTVSYNGEFFGGGTSAGNDVVLIAQPVPEPAALGLLGLAAVGLLARRRRRCVLR